MVMTYDGAWMAKNLTVARGTPPSDFLANCPVCDSRDNLHVGPAVYRNGRVKVHCKGCGALLPDVLAALNADGRNGTAPTITRTRRDKDEQPVVQPGDARRDPRGWLARKCRVSPEFLDDLPISFSGGWIKHQFGTLAVTKDRQAGTKKRRWTPKDTHDPPIWPLDEAMPEEAMFVEGETDCIALRGIGIENVYAITGGADHPPSREQWAELAELGLKRAVIAFDADKAGRDGSVKAVRDAADAGIEVTSTRPADYSPLTGRGKDWCDWIAAGGTLDTFPSPDADTSLVLNVKDILSAPPTQWRHVGYEAIGALHMLYGRPKSGKSTAEYARAAAYERGEPIFGQNVSGRTTTFFMTEEDPETVREKVERFNLRRAQFLTYTDAKTRGLSFAEALAFAAQQCRRLGHGRLVIDTLTTWAEVRDLNDSKEMADAINAIRSGARGLTKVLLYHANKKGGEYGEAILGATGIFASIDVGIEWERDDGRRNLRVTTRFKDAPDDIAVELVDDQFVVAGTPRIKRVKRKAADEVREDIYRRLLTGPVTVRAMVAEGIADGLGQFQVAKYCRELEDAGRATSKIADRKSREKAYKAVPR